MSIRGRLIIIIVPAIIILSGSIYTLVYKSVTKSILEVESNWAEKTLDIAMITIENQFNSLAYHENYSYDQHKNDRENIVSIITSLLNDYQNKVLAGELTLGEAQSCALNVINTIRYDNGKGYVWLSNTNSPIPKMILHPIKPSLNNTYASDSIYYLTNDSTNFLSNAVKVCEKNGKGIITYQWQNPNDSIINKKLSYVELFKPWGWIIGTGFYMYNINSDVDYRLRAIADELKNTLGNMKIGDSGFFFVFNSKAEFVLLPENPMTRYLYSDEIKEKLPLNDIIQNSDSSKIYTYSFNKFSSNNYIKNIIFTRYFKELDWYVCTSISTDEIQAFGLNLGNKILFILIIFSLILIVVAISILRISSKPIIELHKYVSGINLESKEYNSFNVPIMGSPETKMLGEAIKEMLISINNQNQQLIDAKIKAEKSDKLITSFLANMSHEIRTPLNAIVGFSSLLTNERSKFKLEEYINVIINSSDDLITVIDNVLDLSKIESKQIAIFKRRCNINQLILELHEITKTFLDRYQKNNKIDISVSIPDDELIINSDPKRIKQIMINLFTNAIKFSNSGKIEFGFKHNSDDNNVCFYVKDQGIGIPEINQETIFDRFVTFGDNEFNVYRGIGLGLPISKSLVELLGGNIGFDSIHGQGSVFYFTIPVN